MSVYQGSDLVTVLHRPGYYGLETWEGELTGFDKNNPASRDTLWVEGWLKQREGDTNNIFMRHDLKHLKFTDL